MLPGAVRHLLRTTPTVAPVPNRALLYLSGSQATEFLNGVVASTVPNPPRGPFFSALLHAQGRVLYDIFVYPKKNARGHDGYFIEYDSRPSEAPPLLHTLKRFILRSKVKVEDVSNEYDIWSIWGSEDTKKWESPRRWSSARSGVIEPAWDLSESWPWSDGDAETMSLRDRRAVGMGKRVLIREGDKPSEVTSHDTADHGAYTLHRILHGVPEGIDDIPPLKAFPMESNLDIMGGLDFRKGCYVGQELTVRTYHTGVLRKRILPVRLERNPKGSPQNAVPSANADIRVEYEETVTELRPRVRGTGKLLSSTEGVGLAIMRLEQVDLVEKGILKFRIGESWDVSHWWPDWWPRREDGTSNTI
ncbi:Aminomethyltransferase folate-binding domain-containing protein [Sanghuangporus baumii]|uniref:Aminomethyltransferase folate-binding domain-containing protein n=1 Tax=Sanghuangporus baumii TaxID=108892 RepID=A0A9Q5HX53_SANBA|nr:Aminomethyltransferase folate-binding domain-containing protein [Sanghuangporus baumii]